MPSHTRRHASLGRAWRASILAAACVLSLAGGLLAAGPAQASALPTATLTLTKSSITLAGVTQSGAYNVLSTGTGFKENGAILFLLKPGVSTAEAEGILKGGAAKDPNNTEKYGSIVFDAEVTPGKTSEAQTYLQPGQYIALIPGEGKGAKAYSFFSVSAASAPVALPTPGAIERSIDFGFRGPTTLHDGEVVRFENEGFVVHMDVAFPAKSHSAAKKIAKDLLTGNEKGLEKLVHGEPFGFAGPLSHEAFMQETITAKPGWYVQACFMNTQDGRDHTLLGMERVIRIVK